MFDMCIYCDKLNLMDPKQININLDAIGSAIKETSDDKLKTHLWTVSEKLIDLVVPMSEADDELNKTWAKQVYKEDHE